VSDSIEETDGLVAEASLAVAVEAGSGTAELGIGDVGQLVEGEIGKGAAEDEAAGADIAAAGVQADVVTAVVHTDVEGAVSKLGRV